VCAELGGEKRARGRKEHVRRHGGDDDEIDVGRIDARVGEGLARGGKREVARRLVGRGDVPLLDPGPLGDPFVRGVDERGKIVVRHHLLGDVRADPGDPDRAVPRDVRQHRVPSRR
jgi:hypothetical protein